MNRSWAIAALCPAVIVTDWPALSKAQEKAPGTATSPAPPDPQLQPVPKELATSFLAALRKTSNFAANTGRVVQPSLLGFTAPEAPFPVWVVEFQYKEKDGLRTGVVMLVDVPAMEKRSPGAEKELTARDGVWGAASVFENETFIGWRKRMAAARIAANEAGVVGDIRSVVIGEEVLKSVSGNYGDLACLNAPVNCAPGSKEPAIVAEEFTAPERAGYRRTFHPGAPAKGKTKRALLTWAFVATPMDPAAGRRARP